MKKGKDGIYNRYVKRILDITVSLAAILILSPLLLVLTVAGAIAMRGNPFFVQERPGKIDPGTGREKIFKLVKYRTMSNQKDSSGKLLPDGKRLNGYGLFLRKTSLDELPELFGVLAGHLSLVGPRPLLTEYLPYYTAAERERHTVRPGLTGWAQVNGRNMVEWTKRFALDIDYVRKISFPLDMKILFLTAKKVLSKSDIAEDTSVTEGNFAEIRKSQMGSIAK